MTRVYIGANPVFDRKVAIKILDILALREQQNMSSTVYSDIVGGLNASELKTEHPQKFFVAAHGRGAGGGYVHTVLSILEDEGLLAETKNSDKGYLRQKNVYHLTDEGRKVVDNPESWEIPVHQAKISKGESNRK